MHLQAGSLLGGGKYKIEKVLGQGGFGITYLAEQTSLGRKVAIKEFFMKEHCERDSGTSYISVPSSGSRELVDRFRQKFIKEARNIASLEHKHIVPIIDVFEENGTAYYVMKYFSGGSLSFNSAIPEDVALRYTNQLASALRFIHQKRMMHLDVKPSNILLDDEDNVVLIDFGLAKQYDNAGQQTSTTPVGISHGYAPIEQYRSGGVSAFSPATDIYSLGATLYKLLTGTVPPEAMDLVATGLPACPANVSAETWNAVKSAMQPAASSRPQSVDEFLRLVENGKMQDESDGETVLNGNVKGASKREGENLFTHTASESSFDEVKGENGKLVADESQSIDVVEVPDSADTVISNEGEKSHSADAVILNDSEKSQSENNEILDFSPSGRRPLVRSAQNDNFGGNVISNESEKSQKNKSGKFLWLILLLLLIAVAGAWFLFGGAGNGDASKTNASPTGNQSEAPEVANEAGTLIPILDSATDKFGFIDQSGTEVVPCKYDIAYRFSEGLAAVKLNDRRGFIDQSGTEVVPCKYDFAYSFSEGLAAVELNDKYGFIDQSGTEVIPYKYDLAYSFSEGLARVELNGKWGFIDQNGTEVIPCKYDVAYSFSEGLAAVRIGDLDNGKWGFIDQNGTEVIPYKYDWALPFSEGLARVELNGKFGSIDKNGTEVIPCKYDDVNDFSEGLAAVELNDKEFYIDKTGTEVIPCKYDWAFDFSEGLAAVELNDKWGYIDHNGTEVIPCKYDFAYSFSEGLATVELNGKWGFIDQSGTEVIPYKYDWAGVFSEGLAAVKLNDKEFYIDKTGKEYIK